MDRSNTTSSVTGEGERGRENGVRETPTGTLTGTLTGNSELDRRLTHLGRHPPADIERLLADARAAIADDMSSSVQFGSDLALAEGAHRKWQQMHRYVQRIPFRDDPAATRVARWQVAMAKIRVLDDLDLIDWVQSRIDDARTQAVREQKGLAEPRRTEPVYLVLLRHIAGRKRQARAQLRWAREAAANGWGTCNEATLGSNVLDLHAASVHSRDNPAYHGPCDGAYRKD